MPQAQVGERFIHNGLTRAHPFPTTAGRGEVEAVAHEVPPLEQAVAAHRKRAAGEVFGRIVLTPSAG